MTREVFIIAAKALDEKIEAASSKLTDDLANPSGDCESHFDKFIETTIWRHSFEKGARDRVEAVNKYIRELQSRVSEVVNLMQAREELAKEVQP